MTLNEAKEKFSEIQQKQKAYSHLMGILQYDGATGAPPLTADNRGRTMGLVSELQYALSTSEETYEALETLSAHSGELDEVTNRCVFLMLKELRQTRRIPMDEYIEYTRLINMADDVWHKAKQADDYAMFEPWLDKVFTTLKRFAGYFDPEKQPYDVWLGEFEEGLTMERCDKFFAALKEKIIPLLKRVGQREQPDSGVLTGSFPDEAQHRLGLYLMELMGIDSGHCGLSTTEHPFTISFSKYDVRITTNYRGGNFASSMYSVIHEGGHALYDLHVGDELAYTRIGDGVSMGIHESQSRFYENLLGRSRPFIEHIFPKLQELFPDKLKGRTADDVYRAVNRAEPSLIRIDADELTYCLHIMIRYEIEKRVFAGEVTVKELPELWNRLYKEYLGVDVPDDKNGILQDSHWSGGNVGYFPSYALGSAYGAQLLSKMKETVDVDACLQAGDLKPINAWLEDRIWKFGALYPPAVLLEKALGEPFDPKYYTDYLEKKFTEIYAL